MSYLITEWLGLGVYYIYGNASWRLLFGLQFVPAVLMLAGSYWMPESPRWLALADRYEDALTVLQQVHSNGRDDTFYQLEFQQIKAQIQHDKDHQLGVKDIFTKRSYIWRIALIVGFFFAQQ